MASFNRGQLPARQTKVVDHGLGPLEAGPTRLFVPVCNHDAASSKPSSVGRDVVDIHLQTKCDCVVNVCGSKRCKTCKHVHECSTFNSNVTHKTHNIVSPSLSMNCGTENIIYLITCRKCGIQYVGEMGQSLRKRMNNHRNRLKKLSCQYLYQHFNSDGHTEDDISIVPIEEVKLTPADKISLRAKRLEREDFWYRELCTIYPYGLNDNVRKVGNVSKLGPSTVVHALFNKQRRKFKKRQGKRHRSKVVREVIFERVDSLLANNKCIDFCFYVCTYIFSLQRKHLMTLLALIESWAASHDIPSRISLLVKDLIAFKMKSTGRVIDDACGGRRRRIEVT